MTLSIGEIAVIIRNPRDGDEVPVNQENYQQVVPALWPWWICGTGYADGIIANLENRFFKNPIRYANIKAIFSEEDRHTKRGWELTYEWAVKGLTKEQKAVLRSLPALVDEAPICTCNDPGLPGKICKSLICSDQCTVCRPITRPSTLHASVTRNSFQGYAPLCGSIWDDNITPFARYVTCRRCKELMK